MINVPKIPKPENPAFIDKIIVQIQDTLANELSWLDHSFGQAQKLVKDVKGRDYFYPGVHIRDGKYVDVLPDQDLGNFSFFLIEDPQNIDFRPHTTNDVRLTYSLIFWVNLEKIDLTNTTDRNKEAVKAEIVKLLTRKLFLTYGRIDIRQIYERAENIYREFSVKEIKDQFLMQPYYGFRFEGEMSFVEDC